MSARATSFKEVALPNETELSEPKIANPEMLVTLEQAAELMGLPFVVLDELVVGYYFPNIVLMRDETYGTSLAEIDEWLRGLREQFHRGIAKFSSAERGGKRL